MKIAVIGNSHLAALKLAVRDNLFSSGTLDVVFWGLPGPEFRSITYNNGRFQTPHKTLPLIISDGRYESLPAYDFDAIVFHGMVLNLSDYLFSLRKSSDGLLCYSSAFLRDGLRACIEQAPSWNLVRSLRADYDRRVLMSCMPLKSEDSGQFQGLSITADDSNLLNSYISAILSDIRVEYVPQPSDTICDHKYTKREFCVHSVRLAAKLSCEHPADDHIHMNKQYGERVLRDIAVKLGATSETTLTPNATQNEGNVAVSQD